MNSTDPQVIHEEGDRKGAFRIGDTAEMTYSRMRKSTIVVKHTEVVEAARGQGLALALYQAMVQWAHENDVKVVPICRFVKAMFERYPEHRDLLA